MGFKSLRCFFLKLLRPASAKISLGDDWGGRQFFPMSGIQKGTGNSMKKVIWKFKLENKSPNKIMMPVDSEILKIGLQRMNDKTLGDCYSIKLWANVDPEYKDMVEREFVIKLTGEEYDCSGLEYLETISIAHDFVVHIFERVG